MALSDNMRGALFMMGTMTAFTINDACMKILGEEAPLFQLLVLRGIGTALFLWWLAWRMGHLRLSASRRDWWLMVVRSLSEVAGAWFFMTALFHMPIANLSAILQALPLTVTLASALFLGEKVGWRRFTAILIGFAGVALIVRPGPEGFTIDSIYGLATVVCVTIRDITARQLSKDVPSLLVSLVAAVFVMGLSGLAAFVPMGLPGSGAPWVAMDLGQVGLMALTTAFVIVGYILSVSAMRVGEIGFVAPFRYTSLVVAILVGVLVFGTFPDALTLLGAAIVVVTGLYTLLREWQLRRAGRAAMTAPTTIPARHRGL